MPLEIVWPPPPGGAGRNNRDQRRRQRSRDHGGDINCGGRLTDLCNLPLLPLPTNSKCAGQVLKDNIAGANAFFVSSTSLPVLSAILLSLRSVPVLLSVSGLLSLGLSPPVPLPFSTGFGGLIFARSPEVRQPCPEEWPHAVRLRFSCAPFPLHPEGRQVFQVSTPAYPVAFLQVSEQVVTHRQERYRISRQHWYIYPAFPCWTPSVTTAI